MKPIIRLILIVIGLEWRRTGSVRLPFQGLRVQEQRSGLKPASNPGYQIPR
jgi:hypothetical protein